MADDWVDAPDSPGLLDGADMQDGAPDAARSTTDPIGSPTSTPPWLDDLVMRYGEGDAIGDAGGLQLQPISAQISAGEGAQNTKGDPDYNPYIDPVPPQSVDPGVQKMAEGIRDLIRSRPDYDQYEYSSTIYRTPAGEIRQTPLIKGGAGVVGLGAVPSDAEVLGYVHNHPYTTEHDDAVDRAHYTEDQAIDFLGRQATQPSSDDMASLKSYYGSRVSPSAMTYVYGPDDILSAYDPRFIGYPPPIP